MESWLVRFGDWLNATHPIIRISIKTLVTILLGAGFLYWQMNNLFLKFMSFVGSLLVILSLILFIIWVFRMDIRFWGWMLVDIRFWGIVQIYLVGQGLKLATWIPGALLRLQRKYP